MTIGERIRVLRKELSLTQSDFGETIALKQAVIGQMENNTRNITGRTVILICEKYKVREEWLRSGIGEMFNKAEFVSLDTYAQNHNLTALELDIVRGYMELDPAIRKTLLEHFRSIFRKYSEETANELDIDKEVESYRRELEQEKSSKMSPALPNIGENVG